MLHAGERGGGLVPRAGGVASPRAVPSDAANGDGEPGPSVAGRWLPRAVGVTAPLTAPAEVAFACRPAGAGACRASRNSSKVLSSERLENAITRCCVSNVLDLVGKRAVLA